MVLAATGRDQRHPGQLHPGAGCGRAWRARDRSRPAGATDPKRGSGGRRLLRRHRHPAYNLGRYITGLLPEQIPATQELRRGPPLDDYGTAVIRTPTGRWAR